MKRISFSFSVFRFPILKEMENVEVRKQNEAAEFSSSEVNNSSKHVITYE